MPSVDVPVVHGMDSETKMKESATHLGDRSTKGNVATGSKEAVGTFGAAMRVAFLSTLQMRYNLLLALAFLLALVIFGSQHWRYSLVDFRERFNALEAGRAERRSTASMGPLKGALELWWRFIETHLGLALAYIGMLVALLALEQYAQTLLVDWSNDFWNRVQILHSKSETSIEQFSSLLIRFLFFSFIVVFSSAKASYVRRMFAIHVRASVTQRYWCQWLQDFSYYRIELSRTGDNPDQRIQEDVDSFVTGSLSLATGAGSSVAQFCIFSHIVYRMSPEFVVELDEVRCPGWLLWASLLFAAVVASFVHITARRLELLVYVGQRTEADLRWELSTVRRYAEQVAFSRSRETHGERLHARLSEIRRCYWENMFVQKRYDLVFNLFVQSEVISAFLLLGPAFLRGQINLGTLMSASRAMALLNRALMWLPENYSVIASWRASTDRLLRFEAAVEKHSKQNGCVLVQAVEGDCQGEVSSKAGIVQFNGLKIWTPGSDGETGKQEAPRATLLDMSHFEIAQGQRIFISGPTGAGKSSLFRALCGAWPFAEGEAILPPSMQRPFFASAEIYVPSGELRAAVAYPTPPDGVDDEAVEAALNTAGLPLSALEAPDVACERDWGLALSAGQKARLVFARLILQKPAFAAMDEPLAHFDEASRPQILEAVFGAIPSHCTVLLVSHELSPAVCALFDARYDVDIASKTLVERPLRSVQIR